MTFKFGGTLADAESAAGSSEKLVEAVTDSLKTALCCETWQIRNLVLSSGSVVVKFAYIPKSETTEGLAKVGLAIY